MEFKKRSQEVRLEMPDGVVHTLAFDEYATAADCIEMVVYNYPGSDNLYAF